MFSAISKFIYFKLMGWKISGTFPKVDKCVFAVIPHTHWYDFPLGVLIRSIHGKEINYIGKRSLFLPPHGWFFRKMGGRPVDRSKNRNMVEAIVHVFNQNNVFRLALAPEGTRKKVPELKTGFYYIAKMAKVPIVMVAFDYGKKQVAFSECFYPSNHFDEDLLKIKVFFKDVKGKVPEYSF